MAKKRALLVGINYPGTNHALRGCVNDVNAMRDVLAVQYGFESIVMLTDGQATTAAMLQAMKDLVSGAVAGDVLYFHYSGHGSQYPNNSGNDVEADGLDEIICPVDLNWRDNMIRDDDLHAIFDKVPAGVNLTVTLDCCNSGSGMDQDNQYQPLGIGEAAAPNSDPMKGGRFLAPPAEVMNMVESRALSFNKPRALTHRDLNRTGLLITGCQSTQTSADAFIGGKYMGAATYYLIDVLTSHNFSVDYKTVVEEMNNKLAAKGFTQRPELNGSASLFAFKYLQPMAKSEPADEPTEDDLISLQPSPSEEFSVPDVGVAETNVSVTESGNVGTGEAAGNNTNSGGKDDDKKKLPIIIGAIAAVALVIFLATR